MLKFFRKIRKNLLSERKTSKYFKYAIGEIVLVVVGILIALQINNWNEERKENAKINTYLKSMLVDLDSDINSIDRMIEILENQIKTNSSIFHSEKYQTQPIDSIVSTITSYFYDYKIVDQTFQKIKNSGLANQLGSEEINDVINNYYTVDSYRFNLFIDYDQETSLKDDEFWFVTNEYEINSPHSRGQKFELPFSEDEKTRKQALIKKVTSNLGRNILRNNISRKSLGLNIIKSLKTRAETLVEIIHAELNKK